MTKGDIIAMARETGGVDIESNGYTSWVGTQTTEFLERFAALVATAEHRRVQQAYTDAATGSVKAAIAYEREACAKVCEEYVCGNKASAEQDFIAESIAADIRSRGETK